MRPKNRSFHTLFKAVLGETFDLEKFQADDAYASMVFDRALASQHFELCNLAARLQMHRQAAVEAAALKPPPRTGRAAKDPVVPMVAVLTHAVPPVATPPRFPGAPAVERRSGVARFTPQEQLALSTMQRLYRKEFGEALDAAQFSANDPYGREVLRRSLASSNPGLAAAAKSFMDEAGRFRLHRRGAAILLLAITAFAPQAAMAAAQAAPVTGPTASGAGSATAGSSSGLMFKIVIPPTLILRVLSQTAMSITSEDVQRGYVEVSEPQEIVVTCNLRQEYMLRLEIILPHIRRATVSTGRASADSRSFGTEGLSWPQPPTSPATSKSDLQIRYRFDLAPGLQPGNYPWPVAVTVMQP
jgi:hypothetical protein